MARRLTNRSFVLYQHYAAKRMLPMRRLEMYLAQAAHTTAMAAGAKDVTLSDYLFDPIEEAEADDAATFFAFNPRPKQRSE